MADLSQQLTLTGILILHDAKDTHQVAPGNPKAARHSHWHMEFTKREFAVQKRQFRAHRRRLICTRGHVLLSIKWYSQLLVCLQ